MLFNIDEKQLMLELKNKDERALKICMNKYYRYVVYIVHIPQEQRIRSRGTERCSASN